MIYIHNPFRFRILSFPSARLKHQSSEVHRSAQPITKYRKVRGILSATEGKLNDPVMSLMESGQYVC